MDELPQVDSDNKPLIFHDDAISNHPNTQSPIKMNEDCIEDNDITVRDHEINPFQASSDQAGPMENDHDRSLVGNIVYAPNQMEIDTNSNLNRAADEVKIVELTFDTQKTSLNANLYESSSIKPVEKDVSKSNTDETFAVSGQTDTLLQVSCSDTQENNEMQISEPAMDYFGDEDGEIRSNTSIHKDESENRKSDAQCQPLLADSQPQLESNMKVCQEDENALKMPIHPSVPEGQSDEDELPSSSDSSDNEGSDSCRSLDGNVEEIGPDKFRSAPTVEGELTLENLPEVEEIDFKLDESIAMQNIGSISSVIDTLVIVKANALAPALDIDSLLFLENRLCIGKIFETFGPVNSPYYSLRFNSKSAIERMDLIPSIVVYSAPEVKDFTGYVLIEQLRRVKGSDASWKNDIEPPPDHIEYSDDEKERQEKARLRNNGKDNLPQSDKKPKSNKRRGNKRQYDRQHGVNQTGFNRGHTRNSYGLFGSNSKLQQNSWNNPRNRSDKSDFTPTSFNFNGNYAYQMPVQFSNNSYTYPLNATPTNSNQPSSYMPSHSMIPGQSQLGYTYNEQSRPTVPQFSSPYEMYQSYSSTGTVSYNQPWLPPDPKADHEQ
ncbi:H/ACA ribonucleoprotein complex non-core subunit NAF1 [Trichoplax sp. H2]|uniref:H/ACA ribonucleoprotein complex non-core subunit NAF1 n=1 Tax=Trichoplax adhaerens TaxID=10228 RepID=B3S7I4_TRIAD|nr:hypothetical protein TRIADDRAFT_60177 [Trichoplax adhaerens]EDV21203.1 hypothetical protein TRIADDRAFT_60177 [Trichoplax adhaerens]RDD47568.1 H/ACA ribonucleoprotein complex non-core subunit NAF1 [Trichoplax sp. H2]|eukprot:XP_002116170.1 hypothetical protein TRIADDRAFT_60177 [Trichoplax adhaerens]